MKYKQRLASALSTFVLLSQTILPSATVVYAETQQAIQSRAPDEQLVFKKGDEVISADKDDVKTDLVRDEETTFTLHREDEEARDVTVEWPEEFDFQVDKTAEINQALADAATEHLQEKAKADAQTKQQEYDTQAEQERQSIRAEADEKEKQAREQADKDGTDVTEQITAIETDRDNKLNAVQVQQATVPPVSPVDPKSLVEFKENDEQKNEKRRLIFHFQEGQKDANFVFKTSKEGDYSLISTYEKGNDRYRSYPARLTLKKEEKTETSSSSSESSSSSSSETSSSSEESSESSEEPAPSSSEETSSSSTEASSSEEDSKPSTDQKVDEQPDRKEKELDAEMVREALSRQNTSRDYGFSSFFSAAGAGSMFRSTLGDDRADVTAADIQFSYEPNNRSIRSGETVVYYMNFSVSGALVEDVRNIDIDIELMQGPDDGNFSSSPVTPVFFQDQSNLRQLAVSGVVPSYNPSTRKLHYHFDRLKPGEVGQVPIRLGTRNGTSQNNIGIFPFATLAVNGRTLRSVNHDSNPVVVRSENPRPTITKTAVSTNNVLSTTPGGQVDWNIVASITTSNTGGKYLKAGDTITITDKPQNGQTMVGRGSWTFTAPSYEEQEKNLRENGYLWRQEIKAKTKVANNFSGDIVRNQAEIKANSISDEVKTNSNIASVFVRKGNQTIQTPSGEFVTGANRGPGTGTGGLAVNPQRTLNENPTFNNTADLELNFEMVNAMMPFQSRPYYWSQGDAWANGRRAKNVVITDGSGRRLPDNEYVFQRGTNLSDNNFTPFENQLKYLRLYQQVDPHLDVKRFNIFLAIQQAYLNRIALRGLVNNSQGEFPSIFINMRVRRSNGTIEDVQKKVDMAKYVVKDGRDFGWNGRPYITVEAADVGINPGDHVESFDIQYGDGSTREIMFPWLWTAAVTTYSVNDQTFSGQVENSSKIYGDYYDNGTVRQYTREAVNDVGDIHSSVTGPRNAQLVASQNLLPVARVVPSFQKANGTTVDRGDNRLVVNMTNLPSSQTSIGNAIKNAVLLPPGVTVKEQGNPRYSDGSGSYNIIKNYNGTGRDLVVIEYKKDLLPKDNSISFEVDVTISRNAPLDLTIDAYAGSSRTSLEKVEIPDGNARPANEISNAIGVRNATYGKANYSLVASDALSIVKSARKIGTNEWFTGQLSTLLTESGSDIEYRIQINSRSGSDIYKMAFMDILPSTNDRTILNDGNRNSKFTPTLKGPIRLPRAWQGKVTVKYNTSTNPSRDDLINMAVYPPGINPPTQPRNVDSTPWLTEEQVTDWSNIHSFIIEYNSTTEGLPSTNQEIFLTMTVPQVANSSEDMIAWNSVAGTINNLQPTEPTRVGIRLSENNFRFRVKKVDSQNTNQALNARFELYRVEGENLVRVDAMTTNASNDFRYITGKNEKISGDSSSYKEYVIKEVAAPDGYAAPAEDFRFRVYGDGEIDILSNQSLFSRAAITKSGNLTTLDFLIKNDKTFSMKLKKVDKTTKKVLPGAVFKIAASESDARAGKFMKLVTRRETLGERTYLVTETDPIYTNINYNGYHVSDYTVTTGADGIATFDRLQSSKTYYAVETQAPAGYVLDQTPVALTRSNSTDETAVEKTNDKEKYVIRVRKTDESGENLAARFYLYKIKNGQQIAVDKTNTDSNNPAKLHGGDLTLDPDDGKDYQDFIVRETVAPDGYLRLPADIQIRVFLSGQIAVLNNDDFKDLLGSDGFPLVGTSVREVEGKREILVTVRNTQDTVMKIKKVDATNQAQVLAGAKFALASSEENAKAGKFLKLNTDQVEWNSSTKKAQYSFTGTSSVKEAYTVTTGEDGIATFEHLDPRKTYYAVEVEAPAGYALDKTPIALTKDNVSDDTTAVKTNAKNQFKFRVGKTDEAGNPLAGRFYFYRKSDLVNRIDVTNTDRSNPTPLHGGSIELKPATGQDYEDFVVRETVAPDGYLRLADDITIRVYNSGRAEILDKDKFLGTQGQPLFNNLTVEDDHWWLPVETTADGAYQFTISVQNIAETAMKLKKVDATNQAQVLAGAKFALADSQENAMAGKFLKLNTDQVEWNSSTKKPQYSFTETSSIKEAYTLTTGEDGIATFEHLDPRKTYYAVEIEAPQGYTLDKTPIALTKDNASDDAAAVKTNAKPKFKFFVGKTDEAGNNLAGRFYFYRKSDLNKEIDKTNTAQSNPTQLHGGTIELNPAAGQDYEDFVLRETVAPQGYLRLTEDIPIRVYSSGKAEILDRDKFLGTQGQPLFNNLTVEGDHWWLPLETLEDGTFKFTISVQNIAETSMKIKKVDAEDSNQVLAGAQFALADSEENAKAGKFLKLNTEQVEWNTSEKRPQYSWQAASSVQEATIITTGDDGIATFEHLDPRKTYYAVEIKAPAGYQLDNTPQTLTKDTNATPLVFKNTKRGLFPRTGGMGMAVFVLTGLSLMSFAVYRKNRYKPRH